MNWELAGGSVQVGWVSSPGFETRNFELAVIRLGFGWLKLTEFGLALSYQGRLVFDQQKELNYFQISDEATDFGYLQYDWRFGP